MYSENREDASDVLQDSFIKVFKKIQDFRFEGSLEGWIRRTVVLTAINAFNKKKRERENVLTMKDIGYEHVKATVNEIISEGGLKTDFLTPIHHLPLPEITDNEAYLRNLIAVQSKLEAMRAPVMGD